MRRTKTLLLGLTLILLLGCTRESLAADFVVAPDGDDRAIGTADHPFATLTRARDAVRAMRKAGDKGDIVVEVRGGLYPIAEPIVFTPKDSAPPGSHTIYRSPAGETAVFTGGRPIAGWKPHGDGLWRAQVAPDWDFQQLFVNGRRAIRARSPNKFTHHVLTKPPRRIDPKTNKAIPWEKRAFIARKNEVADLIGLAPEDLARVTIQMYHSWSISRHSVKSVEPETGLVELAEDSRYPVGRWGPSQRYHIENAPGSLDAPGEWFLARDGTVLYRPLPDEDMRTAQVVAPVAQELLRFDGDPEAGRFVERIALRGIAFRHARHREPTRGRGSQQAACVIPAAVTLNGAREIEIDRCEVSHVGAHGIWFERGCTSSTLTRTLVHDTGAGSVRVGETYHGSNHIGNDRTGGITVDNCILRNGGHIWTGAVGILVGHSGDNRITHNEIADHRYTGVSAGWKWNYAPSLAVRNLITDNHIHHIGWGGLSDMGGIYTLGNSPGTVIRNNVIHDVYSYDHYGAGGWGMYNDQGSTGIVMENNLVYNTKTGGYDLHYGKDLVVRNNILAFSMIGQLRRGRSEKHHALTVEKNIVYWNGGPLLMGNWLDDHADLRNNVYFDESTTNPLVVKDLHFDEWMKKKHDKGSIVADPLFVDPANRDFHLREGSPALALGFKPFDFSKAGVYGDPEWVAEARDKRYPPVEFAPDPPPPPPITINENFEGLHIGVAPPDAQNTKVERKGDSIGVTTETAASGKQSLRIVDSPKCRATYNPHFYFHPNQTTGTLRVAFDMQTDPDTHAWIAWREYPPEAGYLRGPQLWVRGGAVSVGGDSLTTVPLNAWCHYEMTCRLNPPKGKGTWRLEIGAPDQEPRVFDGLPIPAPDWKKLQYLGFISIGKVKATWYLDNIQMHIVPDE